jgi:ubiquinol-cytochrome c reductase iron-sulfur subunit
MNKQAQTGHADAAYLSERRDFLFVATGMVAAVGAAATLWPFVDQMEPSADVLAAAGPIDVDISKIGAGQQVTVRWRGQPVLIVHRTPSELKRLQAARDTALLRDPDSSVYQQPDYANNWHRSIKPEYLVVVGICTHLGCIPLFRPDPGGSLGKGWPGGYFCPCHGSRYDLSGRVFKHVPAPYNLPVPPYHFTSASVVRIGENPPGSSFKMSSIVQI